MFPLKVAPIEQVPKLGALVFRIPLPKIIAVREKSLLSAGFFFIAASPAYSAVDFVFFYGIEQCCDLEGVTCGIFTALFGHTARIDRLLYRAYNQLRA